MINILCEAQVVQFGESAGQERKLNPAFHAHLSDVLNALWQRQIRRSDAETLEELLAEIKRTKKEILDLLPTDIE